MSLGSAITLFFSILFVIFVILLLVFYWIIPVDELDLTFTPRNYNFSLSGNSEGIQFYDNMRYPSERISYRIQDCPVGKKAHMKNAFDFLQENTILEFYPVNSDEEIFVSCDSRTKVEGNLFIAGEGGPVNITTAGDFNVITRGKVLLLRESECKTPNVGIHELLHALGFVHSENKNNLMYEVSDCKQILGEDIPLLINEIYSIPSKPDLIFVNASAKLQRNLLDFNVSIQNVCFKNIGESKLVVYVDGKKVKEFEVDEMEVGFGRIIT